MMIDPLGLVPQVLRARGWRLYTKKGRNCMPGRLIDLWQYGGRAILGHNPPGLLRAIKNNGERGLFTPLPHFAEDRLHKALSALLPGRSFRLYDEGTACQASLRRALDGLEEPPQWRPFLDKETQAALQSAPVLLPVLPCPFPGAPAVIAYDPAMTGLPEKFPPSQLLSPLSLLAAARCVYDLLAAPERGNPRLPKTDRALQKSAVWKRRGIYLYYIPAKHDKEPVDEGDKNYAALFRHFLEGGFLLPPSPEEPAILPGELSPGEDAKLAELIK